MKKSTQDLIHEYTKAVIRHNDALIVCKPMQPHLTLELRKQYLKDATYDLRLAHEQLDIYISELENI